MESWAADEVAAQPAAITLARVARGLTQAELAESAGISQAYLSKAEKGAVDLTGDRLRLVAKILKYPETFFLTHPGDGGAGSACVFPRKRNSLPTSAEKRVRALLEITRIQVEGLIDDKVPAVGLAREAPTDDGWLGPAEIAEHLRDAAELGAGPIENMIGLLERFGVVVAVRSLGNRRLDALGQWPEGRRPVFLTNATAPPDRLRFTLAHELGHAVMHVAPTANQEPEADRFAAELLLPSAVGSRLLKDVDLPRLAQLKAQWGISMAALVRRARDLGTISDYRYKQLNIELSAAGYRTREPVVLPIETPRLLPDLVCRRRAEGASVASLATLAQMTVSEFETLYLEEAV